ncbi:MAG TPA: hypothetical protein VN972_06070 [Methylomirabilota bacterium]|nr:hypothetical protein [Methylomirabilota bacterium]
MVTYASALERILGRAQDAGWAGADPYDALLSPLGPFVIPLGPAARVAFTQATLRSTAFRGIARPAASINPKGLGLFLGSVARGEASLGSQRAAELGKELLGLIAAHAARDGKQAAWGYPFPWQSRFLWAQAGTPNAVVTATIGWHLLQWADHARGQAADESLARGLACGAARFLSEKLNHSSVGPSGSAVSYTAGDASRIVNVSMLAARLLARVAKAAPRTASWVSPAEAAGMGKQATRLLQFALASQRKDGTWPYSPEARGGWVDSFHTGFILESMLDLRERGWTVPDGALERGLAAYEGFFDPDGGGRLFRQPDSPHDAHSVAQGIMTYSALARGSGVSESNRIGARERALRIARWSLDHLWIESRGSFAYRIEQGRRNEQEYLRWVQAWMALGMSEALELERIQEPAPV